VLRSDRISLLVLLVALPLVGWAWIAVMARDMYGPMTGAGAWMMTPVWDLAHMLLLWLMWAVMMASMMLPSAAPMVLIYGSLARRTTGVTAARHVYAIAAGYVTAWAVFSAGAAALQRGLAALVFVSPMMEVTSPTLAAALLLLAGVYQLTPLKHACLSACRSPLAMLMSRWRPGTSGAFRLGLEHGASCVGCCWALMLLLFAGGVMNLIVIAALTAFVAFEKLAPFGSGSARVSGALLIAAALWMLVQ
jgi:predicted metal-binding membrane protein